MERPRNTTFTSGHTPKLSQSGLFNRTVSNVTPIVRTNSFQIPKRPLRQVVVTKPYEAKDTKEMSLKEGEVFNLIETDKTPWGRGEKVDGTNGWFPMDCVYVIPLSPSAAQIRRRESYKVDVTSVIDQKEENIQTLDRKLSLRPHKEDLQNTNILNKSEVDPALQAAQKSLTTKKKGDFLSNFLRSKKEKEHKLRPPIALNKDTITFQDRQMDVGQSAEDEFEFKNYDFSKLKWKLESNSYNQPYILQFDPPLGTLAKGKTQKIKVKLTVKNLITRDVPVFLLSSPGNEKLLTFIARIKCGQSVFGIDPRVLDHTEDEGVHVPTVLALMRRSLMKHDAFKKVGIFRLAGESTVISQLRKKMDKKEFVDDEDVFSVATLVKVWFRELPEPVFSPLSKDHLLIDDPLLCFSTIDSLPDPFHSLLRWLITLTYQCSVNSEFNKMTIDNLAIVISPNLYNFDTTMNPSEGLMLSQKAAKFFTNVVIGYKMLLDEGKEVWKGPGSSVKMTEINTGMSPVLRAQKEENASRLTRSYSIA